MRKFLLLLCIFPLYVADSVHAVSYPISAPESSSKESETIAVGERVLMFYSGATEVGNAIKADDILLVYHDPPAGGGSLSRPTGKVKVTGSIGAYYLEGELVEGTARPGSLALKGTVASIITARVKQQH